jgi:hypothetical protein
MTAETRPSSPAIDTSVANRLHGAPAVEAELVAVAMEQTGAEHGALFV